MEGDDLLKFLTQQNDRMSFFIGQVYARIRCLRSLYPEIDEIIEVDTFMTEQVEEIFYSHVKD